MIDLVNKNILLTGGTGFLGHHIVQKLQKENVKKIIIPRSSTCNLTKIENCARAVEGIDIVIHLAGIVGGIGFNMNYPGKLFYDNLMMGCQLMEMARVQGVKKFVAIGTICEYPKYTPVPFKESDLWNGYPEETNAPYGLAKKMLIVQSQAYRQQYGFNSINLLPVNLYGPNDKFDPNASHVIPALIKKILDAKREKKAEVIVWGTGKATREFLYVEDAAEAIIMATKNYDKSEPVNIGSGIEISIKNLVKLISKICEYEGKIVWDTSKPDGQPRRQLDTSKALAEFGFKATTNFELGLKKEIEWYKENSKKEDKIEYI